jgi:serine/threonine-protein kinase
VYDPEISPAMDAIVLKALVKDPDYRYQSADEMRADIEAALDGQPVAAAAALGSVGYGAYGDDQPTTALRTQEAGAPTSMLPPMRDDDGGFGYDQRPDRRRGAPKKNNTSTILLVVAGILVLVGAIFIGREVFGGSSPTGSIAVPDFTGDTMEEAEQQAQSGGFIVKDDGKPIPCDNAKKGQITKQDPSAATRIAEDETVTVTLCSGPELIAVPNVEGAELDEARDELVQKGFDRDRIEVKRVESERTPGIVIDQTPAAGSKKPKTATITLTIAKEKETVAVPDLTGKTVAEAKQILEAEGLVLGAQTPVESAATPGTIVGQTLQAGQEVAAGSTVNVDVAKAAETAQVPNVAGMSLKEARKYIKEAGLEPGPIAGPSDDNATVVQSNPVAGTQVPKGSPVSLTTTPGGDGGDGGDDGFFGGQAGTTRTD